MSGGVLVSLHQREPNVSSGWAIEIIRGIWATRTGSLLCYLRLCGSVFTEPQRVPPEQLSDVFAEKGHKASSSVFGIHRRHNSNRIGVIEGSRL